MASVIDMNIYLFKARTVIFTGKSESIIMVGEVIANFDLYAWVALGLFVAGILTVLIYDNGAAASKPKRWKQQNPTETSS
jgi:hypothetical protein